MGRTGSAIAVVLGLLLNVAVLCNGGKTSTFVRKVEKTGDMPLDSDVFAVPSGHNAPQQVHITQGDLEGEAVIVSWVTEAEPCSSKVRYWSEKSEKKKRWLREKFLLINTSNTHLVLFITAPSEIWSTTPNTTMRLELGTL